MLPKSAKVKRHWERVRKDKPSYTPMLTLLGQQWGEVLGQYGQVIKLRDQEPIGRMM